MNADMEIMRPMKSISFAALVLSFLLTISQARAADPADTLPAPGKSNTICPISGKPVNPSITMEYEGLTYSFADDASRT